MQVSYTLYVGVITLEIANPVSQFQYTDYEIHKGSLATVCLWVYLYNGMSPTPLKKHLPQINNKLLYVKLPIRCQTVTGIDCSLI